MIIVEGQRVGEREGGDGVDHERIAMRHLPVSREIHGEVGDLARALGRYREGAEARASRVEAVLYETPDGKTSLAAMTASGGIRYDDDKDNIFVGSELFYHHEKPLITVQGDESQSCYWHGALVDAIQYDLVTGKVETHVVAPGALQINR